MNILAKIKYWTLLFGLSFIFLLSHSLPAEAIGIAPAYPKTGEGRVSSSFYYDLESGESVEDALLLANGGDTDIRVMVAALDGNSDDEGQIGIIEDHRDNVEFGAWVEFLDEQELTVPAKKKVAVRFKITAPEDAPVGDTHGGFAVWEVKGEPDGYIRSGGAGVAIKVRTATLAYVTIAGDLVNKYDVIKRWLFRGAKGKIYMRFGYRNTGNTRVSLVSTARVYTMFGFWGQSDFYSPTILPNKSIVHDYVWPQKEKFAPLFGPVVAKVTTRALNYDLEKTGWAFGFVIPYTFVAILALLALIIWMIWHLIIWQRLVRLSKMPVITYKVKSGDTIGKVANEYQLNWKLLATINNLKPPYNLENVKEIYLPDAVHGEVRTDRRRPSFWRTMLHLRRRQQPVDQRKAVVKEVIETKAITIELGGTLKSLALKYGISWQELARLNRLRWPFRLMVGGQLLVPASAAEDKKTAAASPRRGRDPFVKRQAKPKTAESQPKKEISSLSAASIKAAKEKLARGEKPKSLEKKMKKGKKKGKDDQK